MNVIIGLFVLGGLIILAMYVFQIVITLVVVVFAGMVAGSGWVLKQLHIIK